MHYNSSSSSCSAEVVGMLRYKCTRVYVCMCVCGECVGARCKQKSLASSSRRAGQWRGVQNNFPVEFPCSVIRMWKSASAVDCVNFLSIVCLSLFLIVCPCCCCYCCRCCYSFSAIVVGVIAVIRRRRAVACSLFLSTLFRLASPSLRQFPLLTSLPLFYKRHFKVQIEQRALLLSSTTIIGISHTVCTYVCKQLEGICKSACSASSSMARAILLDPGHFG